MPHISVVIPVYKAEACLKELYDRLCKALETLTDDFEILLIEDQGGDQSWNIIKELAGMDPRVRGVQFSRNFGQHYGITAGLDRSEGDWVVLMDCDLQDPPEEIPKLYKKALEGFDVVLGQRIERKHNINRRLSSLIFGRAFNYLSGLDYDPKVAGFKIISKKVVHSFRLMREQLRFSNALITWMGYRTAYVQVKHDKRFSGKSTHTTKSLVKLAVNAIIAYSDKPLRLSIFFGFAMAALSFLIGGYIVIVALLDGTEVAGWASLFTSIYFLGGIIIANLGVIGVYLGKTFEETKRRPLYLVGDTVGFN